MGYNKKGGFINGVRRTEKRNAVQCAARQDPVLLSTHAWDWVHAFKAYAAQV